MKKKTQNLKKRRSKKEVKKNIGSKKVPGTYDILPKEGELWRSLWRSINVLTELHDYHFIETPPIELKNVISPAFAHVKESLNPICSLKLDSGANVCLPPFGILGVMRSYCEEKLGYFASPLKVFYRGPVFRWTGDKKKPIKEFYEYGFEIIGESNDPIYDVQLILTALDFVKILKIKNVTLKVSTLGCKTCRTNFKERIRIHYVSKKNNLCKNCVKSLERYGPTSHFKCQKEECLEIHGKSPTILDYMCHSCNNHFKAVLELLEENDVLYEPDPRLTCFLPFYNRTVFELRVEQNILAVGGRHDYLSEMMCKRSVPAVGVTFSVKNIFSEIERQHVLFPSKKIKSKVFFVAIGEQARRGSLKIINELRMHDIPVIESLSRKSLNAQLKFANKENSKIALIFGQREVFEKTIIIRDLSSGAQENVTLDSVVENVKKRLKK